MELPATELPVVFHDPVQTDSLTDCGSTLHARARHGRNRVAY